MADPVDSVAQYLATDLALGTLGEVVFEDQMPDQSDGSVDTCVVVINTPGGMPSLAKGDNTNAPAFQVVSRSLDAGTAFTNLQTVFEGLHGTTMTTIHGTLFKLIWAVQSGPVSLGRDEKQRFLYVMNFKALTAGVTR